MITIPDSSVSPPLRPVSPFDGMAADYDRDFTNTPLGRMLRAAVWRRLNARFHSGDRILELNCGTGEDALHMAQRGIEVLATDVSMAMTQTAREKVHQAGFEDRVTVHTLAIEDIVKRFPYPEGQRRSEAQPRFDGVLSNFGGLNCVSDWRMVSEGLSACIRRGGFALLCVMGPHCAWEWGWYLRQGQFQKAFRRMKRGGTSWRGVTLCYPSVGQMRRAFAPEFRLVRVSAVGALLPPTYAAAWTEQNTRLLERLNAWERRWERSHLLIAFADHYLLELERK